MFKFNSNHIMTGQIKQILNAFNLPSYKVYTAQHYKYFLDHGVESPELTVGLYIKWDRIFEYKNGKWGKDLDTYGYNNKYLNHTKTLPITNNIYDSTTHEYLGEFLRFQRDYLGIDLMPLYNCFSNNVCPDLSISINTKEPDTKKVTDTVVTKTIPAVLDPLTKEVLVPEYTYEEPETAVTPGKDTKIKRAFWTKNKDFIIYMVPVKFFKDYTIAIECSTGIEICCGLYQEYLEELDEKQILVGGQVNLPPVDMSQYVSDRTYKKFASLRYNEPMLWQGLSLDIVNKIIDDCYLNSPAGGYTGTDKREYYKQQLLGKESLLKLFIKIPVEQKTSITILEGDYRDFNNFKYGPELKEITIAYKNGKVDEEGNPVYDENGQQETETIIETRQEVIWERKQNRFITNYETSIFGEDPQVYEQENQANKKHENMSVLENELPSIEDRPFRPISPLQLLMFNTKESYPFSDRLIEYLTGNVITAWDENVDNIRRTHKVIELNNNKVDLYGAWDEKTRRILYDYMMNGKPSGDFFTFDINHDTLGYVDKDVEKFYTAWGLEYCLDKNHNRIPVTEEIKDKDGNIIGERIVYRIVNKLLTDAEKKLLLEKRDYALTVKDPGAIPMYKQRFVPMGSISTIDIYSEEG